MTTTNQIVRVMNLILILTFVAFYIGITQMIDLTLVQKIIIAGGLLFLYIILSILLEGLKTQRTKKIIVKEKPVIVKQRIKSKQTKYIGSTQTQTYHKNNCRFANMVKPKYLVKENDKKSFKKLGFKACKTCKPDKN